jgi:predicted acetyltransferase
MISQLRKFKIFKAGEPEREAIKSMLDPYLAEIGAGSEYTYFESYWITSKRLPYLFTFNDRPIGFCFIRQLAEENSYELAEFYIMPEYRRKGLGSHAVHAVFSKHPGSWTLSVLPQNQKVIRFWHSVISNYSGENPEKKEDNSGRLIFSFKVKDSE